MSLTTESLRDLTGKHVMNRPEKSFAKRGMKEKRRERAAEALRTRTDEPEVILDMYGCRVEKETRVRKPRRKARRAAKENTPGSTRVENVKLTHLQRHQNLKWHQERHAWKIEEPAHSEILEGWVEAKPTSWKGKNKLGGRTSKC
jgi:hypothetical protein